jgi:hypothetical protein
MAAETPAEPVEGTSQPQYYSATFADGVREYELEQVGKRRSAVHGTGKDSSSGDAGTKQQGDTAEWKIPAGEPLLGDLVGVSFSGGGIRSATFNLGILQALGRLKLLTRIDFLSTVSGGGYIGAWLAAWIRRAKPPCGDGGGRDDTQQAAAAVKEVQERLDPVTNRQEAGPLCGALESEPETVHHLRAHSRYLARWMGFFQLDGLALVGLYLRNLTINLFVALPAVLALVFLIRLIILAFARGDLLGSDIWMKWPLGLILRDDLLRDESWMRDFWGWVLFVVFVALLVLSHIILRYHVERLHVTAETGAAGSTGSPAQSIRFSPWDRYLFGLIMILISALGTWLLAPAPSGSLNAGSSRLPSVMIGWDNTGKALTNYAPPGGLTEKWKRRLINAREASNHSPYQRGLTLLALIGVISAGGGWAATRKSSKRALLGYSVTLVLLLVCLVLDLFVSDTLALYMLGLVLVLAVIYCWRVCGKITSIGAITLPLCLFLAFVLLAGYVFFGCPERNWLVVSLVIVAGIALVCAILEPGSRRAFVTAAITVVYAVTFGVLFGCIADQLLFTDTPGKALATVTFGPPLFIAALLAAAYLEFALAGRWYSDYEREWRARLGAIMMLIALGWLVLMVGVIYIPEWIDNLTKSVGSKWPEYEKVIPWGALLTWFLATLAGALATQRPPAPGSDRKLRFAATIVPVVFLTGLLVIGSNLSVLLVSGPGCDHLAQITTGSLSTLWCWFGACVVLVLVLASVVPGVLFSLHSLYMNRLTRCYLGASLCDQDRRRRGEAGLPAEFPRQADDFTGFDPNDDMPLVNLRTSNLPWVKKKDQPEEKEPEKPYFGPYPIFNTTINLVAGKELAYQDRKGASFILTPAYCGSEQTGYAMVDVGDDDAVLELSLARAMTISGAAVDPNMSVYQSPQLTAFLTLLNARLGWWLRNPAQIAAAQLMLNAIWSDAEAGKRDAVLQAADAVRRTLQAAPTHSANWRNWLATKLLLHKPERAFENLQAVPTTASPSSFLNATRWFLDAAFEIMRIQPSRWVPRPPRGSWHYFNELLGQTDDTSSYVHLSDGGHFENTGAYELIRRRCRYVVVVDAAEDPTDASENLANLVEKVRTDFGIPIEINTTPLRKDANGLSTWHCAVGAIQYDDVDGSGVIGTLLFIRSSLTGDEDADIRNYAINNPIFPHHSTADQFFDETQFECYRALGYHIGMSVFQEAVDEALRDVSRTKRTKRANKPDEYRLFNRRLFAALRRTWAPLSTNSRAGFVTTCRDYLVATAALRDRRELRPLSTELFPELERLPRQQKLSAEDKSAEIHEVDYLLQVMELAWLENDLERQYPHPVNRGWMNVLRRWSTTAAFHDYWSVLRTQYSRKFVEFCERTLNLDRPPICWYPLHKIEAGTRQTILKEFDGEIGREWGNTLRVYADGSMIDLDSTKHYFSWAAARTAGAWPGLAWVLTVGRGGDVGGALPGWKPEYLPLGIVIVFRSYQPIDKKADTKQDSSSGPPELCVYVRGAHRSMGLGRESVWELLQSEIRQTLGKSQEKNLFIRYPKVGLSEGDRIQEMIWTWFFNDLDFVSDGTEEDKQKRKAAEKEGKVTQKEIRLVYRPLG